MSKEVLIRKISSRKFWSLVAGLVVAILVLMNAGDDTITKVSALVTALGSIVGYMFAEAYVDGKRESSNVINVAEPLQFEVLEEEE